MISKLYIELGYTFDSSSRRTIILTFKKNVPFFFLFFFLIAPQLNLAQEKKPKIALVLSGGGAKGIAHIPVLQALDSLGIVPDLIVGTSMGSVVGGLYAMGYSGNDIAEIADKADWDVLLGGSIQLTNVSVEEKSEFNRYLIDLDIKKGKPLIKSSLLNDQNLREFLTALCYPVYNINNFDNLSIPYRAVTTDIVNGKVVILGEGSLSLAMRASMSIPGVFKPVPYKNTLLVDGGILDNFPTDIAKDMGADIIIGSDVGGGMEPIEKLNSIPTLLFQASMLTSNLKNPENIKLCDILIDHFPNLTYSTGDFAASKDIYKEGKIATNQNKEALIALAEKLKNYKKRVHKVPYIENEFVIDTIIYKNISEDNLELVIARKDIKTFKKYTTQDLIEGVNRAMGTNLFSQITYNTFSNEEKIGLELNGFEHAKNQIKGSLHFDTYRGVGLILNYTGRNIFGQASRLIATLDIAEQPRFRVQYQKIFSKEKNWWWRSEAYGEKLIQEVFLNGEIVDNMRYSSFQFDNQINRNLNSLRSYVGLGLNYQFTNLRPKNNPEFNTNVYLLDSYYFNNIEVNAHYSYNNTNEVFFATKGYNFQANLSRSLVHDVDLNYSEDTFSSVSGVTNGFTKLALDFEKKIPFGKKITGIAGATTCFIFEDSLQSDQLSFTEYGYAAKYFLGGTLVSPDNNSFLFPGLNDDELNLTQFMKLNLGLQINPFNKIYITPHFDIASVGFQNFNDYIDDAFSPKGNWENRINTSLLMSAGATFSYYSFLGPITFDTSWVNEIDKVKLFFSIGLELNPSF